jgi:PhnB protein
MSFHAYLFFSGDCRAAMTKYQEVFGGQLDIMNMGDVPDGEGMPGADPNMVIHASLQLDDGLLMASDDPSGTGDPRTGMMVSYTASDAADAKRVFDALAEGGQVTQEPIETFFSPSFGMCVDRWGTPWMVVANMPS